MAEKKRKFWQEEPGYVTRLKKRQADEVQMATIVIPLDTLIDWREKLEEVGAAIGDEELYLVKQDIDAFLSFA